MNVSGEEAKLWRAVRRDTFGDVNNGPLTSANEDTGYVAWTVLLDGKPEHKEITLGPDAVRIVRAGR